jgi:hypothetical protein
MKRITFISGHYGSGKSEFSVNLAITKSVQTLIDLDIVNPYFRSRELKTLLEEHQIELVASSVENSIGSDLPFIAKAVYNPFFNQQQTAIIDLGGDAVGARLIRQFSELIDHNEVDLLICINVYREETSTPDKIEKMIRDIEQSGGLKVTGLINNSNFIRDTNYDDLMYGQKVIETVANKLNLKLVYTGVYEDILTSCQALMGEVLPLKLYLRKKWM